MRDNVCITRSRNIMKNIINKYLHLIPVIVMGLTLPYKFTGNGLPYLDMFFDGLTGGYGEYVRGLSGLQELILIGLLLSKKTRFYGYGWYSSNYAWSYRYSFLLGSISTLCYYRLGLCYLLR